MLLFHMVYAQQVLHELRGDYTDHNCVTYPTLPLRESVGF